MDLINEGNFDIFNCFEGKEIKICRTPSYEESRNVYNYIITLIEFTDGSKAIISIDDTRSELAITYLDYDNKILEEEVWDIG